MEKAFLKFGQSINCLIGVFFVWRDDNKFVVIVVSAMQDGDAFASEFFDWFKYTEDVAIELFPIGTLGVWYEAVVYGIDKIVARMLAAKRAVDFDVEDFTNVFDVLFHNVLDAGVTAIDWKDDAGNVASFL